MISELNGETMAIMTPAQPPADERGKRAEREAYLAFESDLSDEFYVYHSLELLTDDGREAEIDFLVVHPELGMLVVECKGGGVERTSSGDWIRKDRGHGVQRLDKSPWQQAKDQMHALVSELEARMSRPDSPLGAYVREQSGFPLTFGYAVVFPFVESEEANLPLETRESTLLDASDLNDPEERIRACYAYWKGDRDKANFDEEAFEQFRTEILYPPTSLAESLAARIRAEDRQFERLTDEQMHVIDHIGQHARMVVEGGAGSGKSLLAVEVARLLGDDGRRVLLTCFNRKLRDALRQKIGQTIEGRGEIVVNHFHGLCSEAIDAGVGGVSYPETDDPEVRRKFWEEEAPWALLEALESGDLEGWDAVVIDEGQDFHADWWEVLETGLRESSEQRMYVFQDPSQNLFERDNELPDMGRPYPLTWNFRNTTAIAEVVGQLYDGEMRSHPRTPYGEPPEVQRYDSREGQRSAMDRRVSALVEEERVDPSQMAILTPRTKKNSVLAGVEEIGGVPITTDLDENRRGEAVLHSSIGGFKGLERDIIIFGDVDPTHERCSVNARYVAASRAVNRLYVFEKSNWLG